MIELTKDNYLYEMGQGETWSVNIDPPKNKVRTYYEETISAVEYIHENKIGKFQVLYSGGLDSQYICEVLLKLGIDFEPVIIELKNSFGSVYNSHELKYAFDFCESKNLKPTIYDLNFDNFVKTGKINDVAESVTCCAIEMPATMYVVSQLDGFTILGNDPPYLRLEKNEFWVYEQLEVINALSRFYNKFNLNGNPYLLYYTAEMLLAYLLDPAINKVCSGMMPGKTGTNSTKSLVFNNKSNFNMPVYDFVKKDRIKYTGYESILENIEITNHPNFLIFDEYKKKWNAEYIEPYFDIVKRLSINQ
jgi:hypothetical protein